MANEDLSDEILDAAQKPAEASSPGFRARQHGLDELIKADKYLRSRNATASGIGNGLGIRMNKLKPPRAE